MSKMRSQRNVKNDREVKDMSKMIEKSTKQSKRKFKEKIIVELVKDRLSKQ
jgi:hypothetical protein